MSRIKSRLEKMASNDDYAKFVADLTNVSDELERVLREAKSNEEVYNVIMTNDELLQCYNRIVEINKSIGVNLMGF